MKKPWANCNTMMTIKHAHIVLKILILGKNFENIECWSTDITLVSVTVDLAPTCNYIQTA